MGIRGLPVGAGLLALGMPAIAQAPGQGFSPGGWQHEMKMISADVPGVPQFLIKMFAGDRTRKSCLSAYEATHTPQTLLTQDDNAKCRTTRFVMLKGRFDYVAFCTNKRFPEGLTISSGGTYAPATYTMESVATGMRKGKPVKIVTRGTGKHIGQCQK